MLFALPVYCLFRNKHQYSEHRPCVDKKERASVNRTQKTATTTATTAKIYKHKSKRWCVTNKTIVSFANVCCCRSFFFSLCVCVPRLRNERHRPLLDSTRTHTIYREKSLPQTNMAHSDLVIELETGSGDIREWCSVGVLLIRCVRVLMSSD